MMNLQIFLAFFSWHCPSFQWNQVQSHHCQARTTLTSGLIFVSLTWSITKGCLLSSLMDLSPAGLEIHSGTETLHEDATPWRDVRSLGMSLLSTGLRTRCCIRKWDIVSEACLVKLFLTVICDILAVIVGRWRTSSYHCRADITTNCVRF